MMHKVRIGQIAFVSFALLCQGCVTPDLQQEVVDTSVSEGFERPALADDARFEQFKPYAEQSRYAIDHQPWTKFLGAVVFDVGPSSRRRATRRSGGVQTGTRVSTASRSRFRFEGNRVMFHLFNDDTQEFLSVYRGEVASIMDLYDYGDFSRDEQLAFWLNLHNAILIDEIAKIHPVSRPANIRIRSDNNALLFDAKLVRVAGQPLSLNDIRHKIVYANWRSPEVIYGFWDGTIGGVDILTNAFTGANVWTLLRSNGNSYVNSLRGVGAYPGGFGRVDFRVSKIYWQARTMFPDWPIDLYEHLDAHATASVARLLAQPPRILRSLPYDSSTADFSSGEIARFAGSDNAAAVLSLQGDETENNQEGGPSRAPATILENYGAPVENPTMRGGVSPGAIKLRDLAIENRRRRESDVTIEDIETPEDGETSEPAPDEDESETADAEN